MSTFVYYQAIPCEAELLRLVSGYTNEAAELISVANDALFASMLGFHVEHPGYLDIKFPRVTELCKEYSDRVEWHFESHPIKIASVHKLISIINSDDGRANQNLSWTELWPEFESTLGYKIVRGYEPFSEQFSRRMGGNMRISPPHFIKDCAIYCQLIDRDLIPEGLKEYFDGLVNFYKTVASDSKLAVLVMEN